MAEDKRASPRQRTSPGAYIIYLEGSGGIRDLSLDGAFVDDTRPLPDGTRLDLELRFRDQAIPVRAVVRRSVPGQGMGIEFLEMSRLARRRLRIYLGTLVREEKKP